MPPNPALPAKPPTIADVAARAGVSVSTASRVLRGADARVEPELARRVRAGAASLGYFRNALAQSLRHGASTMVGLVVGDMLDPYYGEIAEVVTQRAEAMHGMAALVCNMQRDPLLEIKYCQQLCEHRVSGLILAGGGFDQWTHFAELSSLIERVTAAGIVVACLSPRGLNAPVFCIDNEALGAAMAGQLLQAGHRRIGVLLGSAQSEATQQRLKGAEYALALHGARFQILHGDYAPSSGARMIDELLARDGDITGVVVGSDAMAVGVRDRLLELGRRVPAHISIVSVGNTGIGRLGAPPLTTIDLSLAACSAAALDHVAGRGRGEGADPPRFSMSVVPGGTLAKPIHAAA
jgi:LacI family transcriptional regulator